MENIYYTPYEELNIKLSDNEEECILELPWLTIHAACNISIKPDILAVIDFLNNKTPVPSQNVVHDFLIEFREHPVAYIKPRVYLQEINSEHCSQSKAFQPEFSPMEMLNRLLPMHLGKINLHNFNWQWNIEEILEKSKIIKNNYDPLSAFRAFLRLLLQGMPYARRASANMIKLMTYLQINDEELFFNYVRYYIRQYHHITSTSYEALLPAQYSFPVAKEQLAHFAEEERGHGKFTLRSLKALNIHNPYNILLNPYSPAIMDLLRYYSQNNLLAFSMLVTCFELEGEQIEDPVASLLEKSSNPAAAQALKSHFELNMAGAHFLSGEPYVSQLKAVDDYTVIEAVRAAELFLMLEGQMDKELLNYGVALFRKKYGSIKDIENFSQG
jgi:hypothetical protein